jgi:hypothetical protein
VTTRPKTPDQDFAGTFAWRRASPVIARRTWCEALTRAWTDAHPVVTGR